MKLALIPPFCRLHDTARTDYQLMLPHLISNVSYADTYGRLCRTNGQYVILDNGAAEGEAPSWNHLVGIAQEFGVDEFVVPDILGNQVQTQESALEFRKEFPFFTNDKKMMYVVQGKTYEEFLASAQWVLEPDQEWIDVIGIPRHMISTVGDPLARIRLLSDIEAIGDFVPVHMLGAAPTYPREAEAIGDVAKGSKILRGMDTSLPYNFAFYDEKLSDADGHIIKRPEDYFTRDYEEFRSLRVKQNITTMKSWLDA